MTLHHHNRTAIDALDAARRERASGRRRSEAGELSDALRDARRGDAGAWQTLLGRFTPRLRGVVRSYGLPVHVADDVLQTTWLRLFEHGDRIREPAAAGAWLETIARRESLRQLQASRREEPADAESFEPEPVPAVAESDVIIGETRTAIRRALAALPSRQRRVLMLLLAEETPAYETISRVLEMPIGSIGPTRARGLARLREDKELLAVIGPELSTV